ncbi:MAG TPA: enoyl-CoA hydratase [Candidatus Hydrogenedentes bacterium]|nr:enoyl-CoA hydratase [Candidatus Hydrogenedentota bacterium]HNT89258.1 enoyl-CoA hydratase [Candidatus Hydrogenedentota bacterium]
MDYREILYEVSDRVATITLNRPEKLNAWTFSMEREWRHALADAAQRADVRAIILTGAGRGFCAGADFGLLSSLQDGTFDSSEVPFDNEPSATDQKVRDDFRKPYTFPPGIRKPIIAAINGPVYGLGLVHALFCDVRFASEQATFSTAFVNRGLIAEHGIAWILPRLVGLENALDLLLSGRKVDAAEALRMGLVSRVVAPEALLPEARSYARQLATLSSPRSMAVIKRQVWDGLLMGLGPATDIAIQEMLESFGADDFREGVLSFLEKRTPNFTGE